MKNIFQRTKSREGYVLMVVLTFIFVSLLLGGTILYLSNKDIQIQGDFYQKKTAEEAAESALDWFKELVNQNPDQMMNLMSSFSDTLWYSGSSNIGDFTWAWTTNELGATEVQLSNIQKFKFAILEVDRTNSLVKVKVIGYGPENSKKTMFAIYRIEGWDTFMKIANNSLRGTAVRHAFYSQGPIEHMDPAWNVQGDIYCEGEATFNQGSIIYGDVKVVNQTNDIKIDQNTTITGNVYIPGDVILNSGLTLSDTAQYFYIGGKVIVDVLVDFKTNAYLVGGFKSFNGSIIFRKYGYIGGNPFDMSTITSYGDTLEINTDVVNWNNTLTKDGGVVRFATDESNNKGYLILTDGAVAENNASIDVPTPDEIGIDTQEEEEASANIDNLTINFSLSDLDAQSGDPNFYNNTLKNNFGPSFWEDLADDGVATLNGKTFHINGSLNDNGGFLVVKIDKDIGNFQYGDFSKKIIFVMDEPVDVNVGSNFWNVKEEGRVGIIVKNGAKLENFGGQGDFRGFVWDSTSNRGKYNTFAGTFYGAMIFKGDTPVGINSGASTTFNLVYDPAVLGEFEALGVLVDITGSAASSGGTVADTTIETKKVTDLQIMLLTKYY